MQKFLVAERCSIIEKKKEEEATGYFRVNNVFSGNNLQRD